MPHDMHAPPSASSFIRLPKNRARAATSVACLAAGFLVGGCDQSVQAVNYSGLAETKLTGMYCDAKGDQEQNCKAGDIVVTVKGRERVLCDWGWQIAYQPGSDEVLCVHRGSLRHDRPATHSAS